MTGHPATDDVTPPAKILVPGDNCWRVERASSMSVIVDAAEYFDVARWAMLGARKRIMLIGWDFDVRIRFGKDSAEGEPEKLGDFILWLVKRRPELHIYLLRWDMGALKTLLRGSTFVTLIKWMRQPNIHIRLDSTHPVGSSHHQKIVVIDDCFAFCGGIDLTGDRWDTRAHRDDEPGRRQPNGKPYGPWHDATTALEGPIAAALGTLARERWRSSGGKSLEAVEARTRCWPKTLGVQFTNVDVAISRSMPSLPNRTEVYEIERLYLDIIANARSYIYAENQYFTSRRIAEAIARRLAEADPPEFVLINPFSAEGWLQSVAMDTARARLYEALRRRDEHRCFRIYHPCTSAGQPIYVHAKILISDDRLLRVGSSNLNNRSLRLDTECDVTIDAALAPDAGARAMIAAIRDGLIAEHLGADADKVARRIDAAGSIITAIEALRGDGRSLRPYQIPDLTDVEQWVADHEVLDPETPEEMFEPVAKRGLFRRLRRRR
ncbi:MAG: phospholipase D-like domain-containing protein [Rhodanobacteraceae bacterium]